MSSLRRIMQAIRLASASAQKTLGITGAQLFVLQQLAERPAASLGEIVELTLTDQSSVSVVVSRLVEKGHVTRRRSASDGRRIELRVTASGRALLNRAPRAPQLALVAGLRKVRRGKLKVTADVLEAVARDMGVSFGKPSMFLEPELEERGPERRRSRRGAAA